MVHWPATARQSRQARIDRSPNSEASSRKPVARSLGDLRSAGKAKNLNPMSGGRRACALKALEATSPYASSYSLPIFRRPKSSKPDTSATGLSLAASLEAARARGEEVKVKLLADPNMLTITEMACKLGISEDQVRLEWKHHRILGLDFGRDHLRYPAWQILPNLKPLPALPDLLAMLDNNSWRVFRFLLQRHNELGGARAVDALRQGRVASVLAAAENTATGAFA